MTWTPSSTNEIRKRFSEQPIVAFTNRTVFVLYLLLLSLFGFMFWPRDSEETLYNKLPGSRSPDYKYLHAKQITLQLSFHFQTIPNCIRYIIGVFCYNFKSQTNILCFILTHWLLSKLRYSPCSGMNQLLIHCVESLKRSNVYIFSI